MYYSCTVFLVRVNAGEPSDACGAGNWGATEMEVRYRVGS